jgi:putative membrane protein
MNGMGGFMFPGLGLIIIVVLVIVAIWVIGGGTFGRSTGGTSAAGYTPSETPLEILKRRYAKGEISKEEYDGIKKDLES